MSQGTVLFALLGVIYGCTAQRAVDPRKGTEGGTEPSDTTPVTTTPTEDGAGEMLAKLCMDGVRSGDETHIDCGGSCEPCVDGAGCDRGADCQSGVCTLGTCAPATCTDVVENGDETDIDCGGACARGA